MVMGQEPGFPPKHDLSLEDIKENLGLSEEEVQNKMKQLEELTEVAWYDSEGVFAIIKWDYKNKKLIRKEDIEPKELVPIGGVSVVNADGRTIPQIVKTVYESTLDNYPDVKAFKKINAFSLPDMLPDYPRDKPFDEKIIINFYQLEDLQLRKEHIDDITMSLYLRGGLFLKKDKIQSHLKECESCKERLATELDKQSGKKD